MKKAILIVFSLLCVAAISLSQRVIKAEAHYVPSCQVVDVPAHWEVRHWISDTYKCPTISWEYFGHRVNVVYEKSSDPNKCHRPSDSSLKNDYKMSNDERGWFKLYYGEWMTSIIDVKGHWTNWENGRSSSPTDQEKFIDATYKPGNDVDHDGVCDNVDNCPTVSNSSQTDSNHNGIGDACEVETDVCKNIFGKQSSVPTNMIVNEGICSCAEGYHRANTEEVRMMVKPSEEPMFSCVKNDEPEPSTEPTPTPTPDPSAGKTSGSWIQTNCDGHIDVRMNLYEDGKAKDATTVFFRYMNETKEAKTNSNGEAQVGFDFRGEEKVSMSADGFPGQEPTAKAAVNCASSSEGKVLGATTLASTGVVTDSVMGIMGIVGSLLTAVGLRRYGKKN